MKTKLKALGLLLLAALVALPLLTSCAAPAAEEITLRYSVPYAQGSVMTIPSEWFMDEIEARTEGRITFERYFAGTITKGGEELDAIKDRVADCGLVGPWYYAGRLYLWTALRQVPFGIGDVGVFSRVVDRMMKEIPEFKNEIEQYNQKIIFQHSIGSYEVYNSTPIKTLDDFKGKKLGCVGLLGKFVESLGSTPVPSPIAERYMNLQTGAEDGGLLPWASIIQYKLQEICPYMTYVGLGCSYGLVFTVNNDAWSELSKADQDLFLEVGAMMLDKAAELLNAEEERVLAEFKAEGVEFFTLPDADRARWADLLPNEPKKYAEEVEAKGLPGNKVFELYFKLAKEEGWKFYRDWWAE